VGNCEWKTIYPELGMGVCIDNSTTNCEWCNKAGTQGMDNTAFNSVLGVCTREKANALSTDKYPCFYSNGMAKDCSAISCLDYTQCPNTVELYNNNSLVVPAAGRCDLKVCQNYDGKCRKNADGDLEPDCSIGDLSCERDIFPPDTIMSTLFEEDIPVGFDLSVTDKTADSILSNPSGYKTFLCVDSAASDECPNKPGKDYGLFTSELKLSLNGLRLSDFRTDRNITQLFEGNNTIYYFTKDKANNSGIVKSLRVEAHANNTFPEIYKIEVDGGRTADNIMNVFYTNVRKPGIRLYFREGGAKLTNPELRNLVTNQIVISSENFSLVASGGSNLFTMTNYSLTPLPNLPDLPEGGYKLVFSAINENNIPLRASQRNLTIKTNYTPITAVITPAMNEIVNKTPFNFKIQFPRPVNLSSVLFTDDLGFVREETVGNFTNPSSIFSVSINISDGTKIVDVIGKDYYGNDATGNVQFIVNARPPSLSSLRLLYPPYGVSPTKDFTLKLVSDNKMFCRYIVNELITPTSDDSKFYSMNSFDSTNSSLHIKQNPKNVSENKANNLFVWCIDSYWRPNPFRYEFKLRIDNSSPVLTDLFTFPRSPIGETGVNVTLTAVADEPVRCKYSATNQNYNQMENKFENLFDGDFRNAKNAYVFAASQGDYKYYIACENEAGLISETKNITFVLDESVPLRIYNHTDEYQGTSSPLISVETNKRASCVYGVSEDSLIKDFKASSTYNHTVTFEGTLPQGINTVYVKCYGYSESDRVTTALRVVVDTTKPNMSYVNDTNIFSPSYPEISCNDKYIRVNWFAREDSFYNWPANNPGIYQYSFRIKSSNGTVLGSDTCDLGNEWVWVPKNPNSAKSCGNFDITMGNGQKYFIEARAENLGGIWGDYLSSNGIWINLSSPACGCSMGNDGICCRVENNDGICDPNCQEFQDTDCRNCTGKGGDCCKPVADGKCDPDCPIAYDPDCKQTCQPGSCFISSDQWCDRGFLSNQSYCQYCSDYDSQCSTTCTRQGVCDKDAKKWCKNSTWTSDNYCSACMNQDLSCPVCLGNVCDLKFKFWCKDGQWNAQDYCSHCKGVDSSCNQTCEDGRCDVYANLTCVSGKWNSTSYCDKCYSEDSECSYSCKPNTCDTASGSAYCSSTGKWIVNITNYCNVCGKYDASCNKQCENNACDVTRGMWCDQSTWKADNYCSKCNDASGRCPQACTNGMCDIFQNKWCNQGSWASDNYCSKCYLYDFGCFKECTPGSCDASQNKWCSNGLWSSDNYCFICGQKDKDCYYGCVEGECNTNYTKWCHNSVWTNESYCSNCRNFDASCLAACTASVNDNCCNPASNGICDPNCQSSQDPDCTNCTSAANNCCYPAKDGKCDLDCLPGIDPDCNCRSTGTCGPEDSCEVNSDCRDGNCLSTKKCAYPTCSDAIHNGNETDVDCGGNKCNACKEGEECKSNSDCESDLACRSLKCQKKDECSDNKLSPGEGDVDCGGVCPDRCGIGQTCNADGDCESGASCVLGKCKITSPSDDDKDKDGMSDKWEIDNNLDITRDDSAEDPDKDGFTNLQEYQNGTDPHKSDKKSSPLGIVLLIIFIVIVLALIAYLLYTQSSKKKKPAKQPIKPSPTPFMPPQRRIMPPPQRPIKPVQSETKKEKSEKRESIFNLFASEEKPEEKESEKEKKEEVKEEKKEQKEEKPKVDLKKEPEKEKKEELKQPSEDVFTKLSSIIKGDKKAEAKKVTQKEKQEKQKVDSSSIKKIVATSKEAASGIKKDLKEHSKKLDSRLNEIEKKVAGLSDVSIVYATKTGTKFHHPDCITLKDISKSDIIKFNSIKEAQKKKLEPCKVCIPKKK
jgi:hypothetical protein